MYLLTLFFIIPYLSPPIVADPISCAIRDIQKQKVKGGLDEAKSGSLQKYFIGYDYLRRQDYITVEVRAVDLDKGSDLTEAGSKWIKDNGVNGDQPGYVIAKKLGGPGNENNLFPQGKTESFLMVHVQTNSDLQANVDKWKAHEDQVYKHLKEGKNRHARLIFAMEYTDEEATSRPTVLYYFYALYKDDVVTEKLRGKIENAKSAEGEKNEGENEGGSEEDKTGD